MLEHREQLEQFLRDRCVARLVGEAHSQVLFDAEPAEDLAPLRHIADALANALVRRVAGDVAAVEPDRSGLHRDDTHQALEQRRLADAVASEDHRHLALRGFEADLAQDVRAAVVLIQSFNAEHFSLSCFMLEPLPEGARGSRAFHRRCTSGYRPRYTSTTFSFA